MRSHIRHSPLYVHAESYSWFEIHAVLRSREFGEHEIAFALHSYAGEEHSTLKTQLHLE